MAVGEPSSPAAETWLDGKLNFTWSTKAGAPAFHLQDSTAVGYAVALHWSTSVVLTVGSGDIHPVNASEEAYATAVVLSSFLVVTYCAGELWCAMIRTALDPMVLEHRKIMAQSQHFMLRHKVPKSKRQAVRNYFVDKFYDEMSVDEADLLSKMPSELAMGLCEYVHAEVLAMLPKSQLFEFVHQPHVLNDVVVSLKRRLCEPRERVVTEGRPGSDIYIILNGNCQVLKSNHPIDAVLSWGDVFGEAAAFGMGGGPDGQLEMRTIQASSSDVVLGVLTMDGALRFAVHETSEIAG